MKIRGMLLAGLLLAFTAVQAQDAESVKKQINSVKKSSAYLYGEATAETEEEARNIAEEILYQEINAWAAKKKSLQGNSSFVINNKKELQSSLALPRGNMFRAFVFVKKSDITAGENSEIITVAQAPAAEGEPLAAPTAEKAPAYPEAVTTIAAFTEYAPMAAKIKELKASGTIGHYGRYASLEKPEIYYLAIYNPEGKVVAVLTPGTDRTNVRTGQPDKVTNYSGCGAIGFTVHQ